MYLFLLYIGGETGEVWSGDICYCGHLCLHVFCLIAASHKLHNRHDIRSDRALVVYEHRNRLCRSEEGADCSIKGGGYTNGRT